MRKVQKIILFIFLSCFFVCLITSSILVSAPNLAAHFISNGDLINNWYWLRDSALTHYTERTFNNIASGASDLVLDITALATDKISGGRDFEAHFLLVYGFPGSERMRGVFQTKEITLPNISSAYDLVGYTCMGFITIPRDFIADATTFFFRIERISPNDHHVDFNQDSILLFIEEPGIDMSKKNNAGIPSEKLEIKQELD